MVRYYKYHHEHAKKINAQGSFEEEMNKILKHQIFVIMSGLVMLIFIFFSFTNDSFKFRLYPSFKSKPYSINFISIDKHIGNQSWCI